jgi:hypothetical protein
MYRVKELTQAAQLSVQRARMRRQAQKVSSMVRDLRRALEPSIGNHGGKWELVDADFVQNLSADGSSDRSEECAGDS